MTSQEAKEVLLLYRPGISDPNDAEFVEALACARNDQELDRWFRDHCAVQTVIRNKFREITVPEGLKEQIISERRVKLAGPTKRAVLVASLCILLALLISGISLRFWRHQEDTTFTNFQARMVKTVARAYPPMDVETSDPKQIRDTLAQKGGPDYVLPARFDKVSYTGCAVLPWQGKPVSMVCFNSGKTSVTKPDLFLFVINRADVPRAPKSAKPQFAKLGALTVASWTNGDKTYLLAGAEDEASLRDYF